MTMTMTVHMNVQFTAPTWPVYTYVLRDAEHVLRVLHRQSGVVVHTGEVGVAGGTATVWVRANALQRKVHLSMSAAR